MQVGARVRIQRRGVLLVEDNSADAALVKFALAGELGEMGELAFRVDWVERLADGLKQLSLASYDVILLDLNLPDSKGLRTFLDLHRATPDVPIVILSGTDDEALAKQAVKQGAEDFLQKDQMTQASLRHAIRYAVERHAAQLEKEALRMQLDLLTRESARLRESARTRASMIAAFANDLRTPLTPLRSTIDLMKSWPPGELGAKQRSVIEMLDRNVERFAALVEKTLKEAASGPLEPTSPDLVAESRALSDFAKAQSRQPTSALSPELPD